MNRKQRCRIKRFKVKNIKLKVILIHSLFDMTVLAVRNRIRIVQEKQTVKSWLEGQWMENFNMNTLGFDSSTEILAKHANLSVAYSLISSACTAWNFHNENGHFPPPEILILIHKEHGIKNKGKRSPTTEQWPKKYCSGPDETSVFQHLSSQPKRKPNNCKPDVKRVDTFVVQFIFQWSEYKRIFCGHQLESMWIIWIIWNWIQQ